MNLNDTNIADNLFGMIKNLSAEVRLELISRITESLKESQAKDQEKQSWKEFYGSWDDPRSANEIIEDLRSSRSTNRQIEDF